MGKRISYQAHFKSRVALEALKESRTLSDLSHEFKIHQAQISKWKTQAVQGMSQLFEDKRKKKVTVDIDIEALYAQIGRLQSQLEFLKKKTGFDNS